jgi:hypothetical protein
MPAMFSLLERFPDAEFGSPGPLVSELEVIPGYETLLELSVARQPTELTIWMINRILNVSSSEGHARWLSKLESTLHHPLASAHVREAARMFIQHQTEQKAQQAVAADRPMHATCEDARAWWRALGSAMEVRVLREACCAQDDQIGPLEASYIVNRDTSFEELVVLIQESQFLQYSSTHVTLQGEIAGTPVVRVFSPFYMNNKPAEFYANAASQSVASVVGVIPLQFRFVLL